MSSGRRRKRRTSDTPEYRVWIGMRARCSNPSNPAYANYGGRGIRVCERWQTFENFLADMGRRPKKHSIDRIDNDGNYEPGNCRWATQLEQMQNTRRTREISTQTVGIDAGDLFEWESADLFYMRRKALRAGRNLLGWSRAKLAKKSGMSVGALASFEVKGSDPKGSTVQKWFRALSTAGVEFIDEKGGAGVRLRGTKGKR